MKVCSSNYSISVLLPIRNEELYIKDSILSIVHNNIFNKNMELIVIDGHSTDLTVEIVNKIINENKDINIKLLDNPGRIVSTGMNLGIKEARGEFIVRIDSHSTYPKLYLMNLVKFMIELNADNVGGCVETKPMDSTIKSLAISESLSTSFSVGNSLFRTLKKGKPIEVDTVPFGCYRKKIFDRIGLYDEDLVRNQDDELNARLKQDHGKIFLIPNIRIKYYARDSYVKLFSMFYQYGYFKPLVNMKLKHPATFRQFVPLMFVVYLFSGFFLSMVYTDLGRVFVLGLMIYLFSSFFVSCNITRFRYSPFLILHLMASFFLIHFSYGLGYITGIINFLILRKMVNKRINLSR